MRRFVFLFVLILLASCTAKPTETTSDAKEAPQTLIEFFALLNAKKYAEADALYGGDYETLQNNNPDVAPSNHDKLLTNACEMNGFQCLAVRSATLKHQEGDTYVFQVEFNNPDGSLFVLGPCCGANETEMPPVSQFEYTVTKNAEGKFVVMNLPPYVP